MKKTCIIMCFFVFPLLFNCGGGSKSSQSQRFNGDNNEIIAFSFSHSKNAASGIATDAIAKINDNSITVAVPHSASVSALIAEFVTNSPDIEVNGTVQESGITANNFSNPVTYSVSADNGDKEDYVVTVTKATSTEKKIVSFSLNGIQGIIDDNAGTIGVTLPPHTDVTSLAAEFSLIGKSISANGVSQQSGVTKNDFTNSVVYTVTADDNSKREYTVTVIVQKSSLNNITYFAFRTDENPSLAINVTGIISDTDIQLVIPYGSDPSDLIAYFTTEGESVKIDDAVQESGFTHKDFTNAKIYRVTAENGSVKDYTVAVSIAKSDAKAITSFSLDGETGTIDEPGHSISVSFQASKDLTNLIASFTTTGVSVEVNGTAQESGATVNDFSGTVVYTVTAANGTKCDYTVNAVKSGEIAGLWNFEYGPDASYTVNGTTEVPGVTGNALQFDGMTDYVFAPDSDALTLADGGSIEVVLNAITHRPYAGIVHKGVLNDFSDETYSLQFWGEGGTDGTVRFLVHNVSQDADHYTCIDSNTKLDTDTWYHIIAAWDTTHLALYINGVKDAFIETDVGQVKDSGGGLVIGAQMDHQFYYTAWGDLGFNGIIDRVEIFSRSLSDTEAMAHYQDFVDSAGTGFTAYLLSVAKYRMPYILTIFGIIILALAFLYVFNRRRVNTAG